jgi:transcriptional regulator with XRE-family HTH domain
MHIDYCVIGRRIKELRKADHMTQEQLAERLDVTIGYVSQIERGVTKVNLETLGKIANIFDCDVASLITASNMYIKNDLTLEKISEVCKQLSQQDRKIVLNLLQCYQAIKRDQD